MPYLGIFQANGAWPPILVAFGPRSAEFFASSPDTVSRIIDTFDVARKQSNSDPSLTAVVGSGASVAVGTALIGFAKLVPRHLIVACIAMPQEGAAGAGTRAVATVDVVTLAMSKWGIASGHDVLQHAHFHAFCTEVMLFGSPWAPVHEGTLTAEAARLWNVINDRMAGNRRAAEGTILVSRTAAGSGERLSVDVQAASVRRDGSQGSSVTVRSVPAELAQRLFGAGWSKKTSSASTAAQSTGVEPSVDEHRGDHYKAPTGATAPPGSPLCLPRSGHDREPSIGDSVVCHVAGAEPEWSAPPDLPAAAPHPDDYASCQEGAKAQRSSDGVTWFLDHSVAPGDSDNVVDGLPSRTDGCGGISQPPARELPAVVMSSAVWWPALQLRVEESATVAVSGATTADLQLTGTISVELGSTAPASENDEYFVISADPLTSDSFGFVCEKRSVVLRLSAWRQVAADGDDAMFSSAEGDDDDDDGGHVVLKPFSGIAASYRSMSQQTEISFYVSRCFRSSAAGSGSGRTVVRLPLAEYVVPRYTSDEREMLTPARCRTQWKTSFESSGSEAPTTGGGGDGVRLQPTGGGRWWTAAHLFKCLVTLDGPPHDGGFRFTTAKLLHQPVVLLSGGDAGSAQNPFEEIISQPEIDIVSSFDNHDAESSGRGAYGWTLDTSVPKHIVAAKFVQAVPATESSENVVREALGSGQVVQLVFQANGCLSGVSAQVTGLDGLESVTYSTVRGVVNFR